MSASAPRQSRGADAPPAYSSATAREEPVLAARQRDVGLALVEEAGAQPDQLAVHRRRPGRRRRAPPGRRGAAAAARRPAARGTRPAATRAGTPATAPGPGIARDPRSIGERRARRHRRRRQSLTSSTCHSRARVRPGSTGSAPARRASASISCRRSVVRDASGAHAPRGTREAQVRAARRARRRRPAPPRGTAGAGRRAACCGG